MTHPYLDASGDDPGLAGLPGPQEEGLSPEGLEAEDLAPGAPNGADVEARGLAPTEDSGPTEDTGPEGVEGSELDEQMPLEAGELYDYRADRRRSRRGRRRSWALVLVVVLVVVLAVGVVGFQHVSKEINPPGKPGRTVMVTVPAGGSAARLAGILSKDGIIHGPTVFEVYLKLKGVRAFVPGTYQMATNEPYSTVLYILQNGPIPVTYNVVVPEGFTVRQIAAAVGRLKGAGISEPEFLRAAMSGQVRSPYEPAGSDDLEGLLFPATYPVQKGETADELVQYMVDTFGSHAAALGLTSAAKRLGYSPYQVVTVASIVEREAKFDSDRGPIASVIYNRLRRGTPIGAESTLLYGLGEPKGPVVITTPNPYNTLVNKGLPPTPISNPGIPSLEAAMNPPKTTYLYWVEINPDGKSGFASNEAQFRQLQAECRRVRLGC